MIRHLLRAWKIPPVLGCLSLLAAFVLPTAHDAAAPQTVWPSSLPRPSWTAPTAPETAPSATLPAETPAPAPSRVKAGPTVPRTTQPVPTPTVATSPSASPSTPDTPTDSLTPSNPPTTDATTDPAPTATDSPTDTPTPEPSVTTLQVWLTAYTWHDNDPPGSAAIANPGVRKPDTSSAGGTGTYDDPLTLAVGRGGWEPGTLVYLPSITRYAIVEDLCGSCAAGHNGLTWIDVWIDGSTTSDDASKACAEALTAVVDAILNPGPDEPVTPGPISTSEGCAR